MQARNNRRHSHGSAQATVDPCHLGGRTVRGTHSKLQGTSGRSGPCAWAGARDHARESLRRMQGITVETG